MTFFSKSARADEAADAAQFLTRIAYVVLALAAPTGLVLHPIAIFILFPVGIVLIALAALLDPPATLSERLRAALVSWPVWLGLGALAWATLSILWTPFPIAAGQHALKLAGWALAVAVALSLPREHARATDLYVFPMGMALGMATILAVWIAVRQGAPLDVGRILDGGVSIATLLFSSMGGLAARGRNGWARLLLILAFVFVFAIGSTPTMLALLVGFAALSFAVSDLDRTSVDLSWLAAGIILLAPILVLIAEPIARVIMNAKLPTLPPPYPSLALTSTIVKHDYLRLVIGHGFETVARAIRDGVLPPQTPNSLLFQVWYELGLVGALLASAGAWFGFRAIGRAPPRLAPYLAAALSCNLTLAALCSSLADMNWFTTLAIAVIVADVAARSQYRTSRPSASHLAHF
jgi:hypothetical protein